MVETQVIGIEGAPKGSWLLFYPVSVRKQATQALLDSGASVNYINADLANRAGGVISRKARGVLLYPDKRQADVLRDYRTRGTGKRVSRTSHVLGCKRVGNTYVVGGAMVAIVEPHD